MQVTVGGANRHLIALQRIAEQNGGNRAVEDASPGSTSDGYNASVDYVVDRLKSWGFKVKTPNFTYTDMIGSPNAGYFVYDGDDSDGEGAGSGSYGSAQIEKTFTDFFADQLDVPTEGTDFDGRSDYGGFIAVGIPSGGLFTGPEGLKTPDQVLLWGGTAGVSYDPCYHQACDNLGNDRVALGRNLDAAAWATGIYGYSTEDINGVPPRQQRAELRSSANRLAAASSAGAPLGIAA